MKATLWDSISVHALSPKVSSVAHIFFSRILKAFSLCANLLDSSLGMSSDDSPDCRTTKEITKLFWNSVGFCVAKGGQWFKLTMPPAREDASLEILEEKAVLDVCVPASTGSIGVILAAARSSTFLATAIVSTLLNKSGFKLTKFQNHMIHVPWWQGKGTYFTDANLLMPGTGRKSNLKLPWVMSNLASIFAGTIVWTLAFVITEAWMKAVFTPMTAYVWMAALQGTDNTSF